MSLGQHGRGERSDMQGILKRILVGREDRQTISKFATGIDRFLGVGLIVSAALLGMALTRPVLQTDSYLDLSGTYSLIDAMTALLKAGHGLASVLILISAILIPILLLSSAFDLWYKHELQGSKFEAKAARLQQFGRLWFLSAAIILFGLYAVMTMGQGNQLLSSAYYLIVSVMLLKLVLLRLRQLISAVQFVEDDDD